MNTLCRDLLSIVSGLIVCVNSHAQIVLNEILAENRSAVPNGSDFPDYIELANISGQAVSLSGASLTDDPANPRRFVFPAGISIPAGGYLVVWADANTGSPGLHTGFGLQAGGEQVVLIDSNGTLLDEIVFGLQIANFSIGRTPDKTGPWQLTRPTPGSANSAEATGSHAELRINEWMARPASGHDWIELFNASRAAVALSGCVLTDATTVPPQNRPIPSLSFIAPRGFVQFFASDLDQPDADHLDFRLGADGEMLTLYAADRSTVLDRVTFGAQTEGVSQGRAPDGSDNITSFPVGRASPGEPNVEEITNVVISEVLSHTDPPFEDAIELQNVGTAPVDVSYWWLSDSGRQPQKFQIPPGTIIPPSGFLVFYEYQFGIGPTGFSLNSSEGDNVFLSAGDAQGRLLGQQTFVEFGALRNGISAGRVQTSAGIDFAPLERLTFGVDTPAGVEQFRLGTGSPNAGPRIGPVAITEIHLNPAEEGGISQQFLELHNPTAEPVYFYRFDSPTNTWRLGDAISFVFPLQLTLPPNAYLLVVSFDPVQSPSALAAFRARFSVPESVPVIGPFNGRLSASGERIDLLQPDEPEGPDDPNAGFVPYEIAERVEYSVGFPWPQWDTASNLSLHRRNPLTYANEPQNWFVGPPTPGRGQLANQDSDNDGMPDDWENAHGLSPNSAADAATDLDNDQLANLQEFRAGTDPRDPASVFRISSLQQRAGQLHIAFPAVQGKTYTLQASTGLATGGWFAVTNLATATANGNLEFVVPSPNTALWYRLSILPQP